MEYEKKLKKMCDNNAYNLCNNDNCERCYNKSFASHDKSKYWYYEKNNNINPRNIFKNCNKKYYFNCEICNHNFNAKISDINKNSSWCPYCSNPPRKLCNDNNCKICYEKSFASHAKAACWDYEKNNNINPRNIFKNSNTKYFFNCNICNHNFNLSLGAINGSANSWCSYCSNPPKKLCNDNNCKMCYNKSFVSHEKAKYWDYDKNNNINPREIFKNSIVKYYFNCENCNHCFNTNLCNINQNKRWCPYCANNKLCTCIKCKICYDKSFASHSMSNYWDYEKNNNINPRQIFKNSNTKYYFNCNKCNHHFDIALNFLNKKENNLYCSYCLNTQSKLCDDNNCKLCYEKSFASHKMAEYWNYDKNNNINPRNVFKNTHTKYYFNCDKCNHDFDIGLSDLIQKDNNVYCPYCMNTQSTLCDDKNCKLCFERSFASHEKAAYWNYEKNNNINPRKLFKNTHIKYYFDCDKCNNSFKIRLDDITNKNNWCSLCKNKTEKIVYDYLLLNKNFKINKEVKFDWSKNEKTNKYFKYDICIENYKLIIEIDGIQHFKNIIHWKNDYKENQERDKYKMDVALKEGYSVIRILQEDIYYNKFDWKIELLENIKKNIEPKIIYICKNNEYFEYKLI